jgi:hypothetical protein
MQNKRHRATCTCAAQICICIVFSHTHMYIQVFFSHAAQTTQGHLHMCRTNIYMDCFCHTLIYIGFLILMQHKRHRTTCIRAAYSCAR